MIWSIINISFAIIGLILLIAGVTYEARNSKTNAVLYFSLGLAFVLILLISEAIRYLAGYI